MEIKDKHETVRGLTPLKMKGEGFDVEAARAKLAGKGGKKYWRTLAEVADTEEFQKWVEDEFPNRSTLMQLNRRDMLKFMGASLALAGLSGCRGVFLPQDKLVPYVRQPEELVPGKSLFYASAVTLAGYVTGVLVEQQDGRPIKIEGNPEHPASLGASDAITQAEVLNFYDPDRSTSVLNRSTVGFEGDVSTWEVFESDLVKLMTAQAARGGDGIRILSGYQTSPTFHDLMTRFTAKYPQARWHVYEPLGRTNARAGSAAAFGGQILDAIYNFKDARVVVSLDGDFLNPVETPGSLRYAREFADGRRVTGFDGEMNRLYSIESTPGLVGAMADHRWRVRASEVYGYALALAAAVGVQGLPAGASDISAADMDAIVKDLQSAQGQSIVVTGEHQPAEVHAVVHAINAALGNVGRTVTYVPGIEVPLAPANAAPGAPGNDSSLASLVGALNGGHVDVLLIIGGNPVYDAPADLKFADALAKAKTKIRLGMHDDETSLLCDWHLPLAHSLEAWGDGRAFDGTLSVVQPLIAPLFEGRSAIEVLSLFLGEPRGGYDLVRDTWKRNKLVAGDFEKSWRQAVHDGLVKGSAYPAVTPALTLNGGNLPAVKGKSTDIELMIRADSSLYDGRYTNNGWLMELPRPLTKLTWDNAAIMSPATAARLSKELNVGGGGLGDDDVIKLTLNGASQNAPVFIQQGHPDDSITLHVGYGRKRGGVVCATSDHGELLATVEPNMNDGMGGGGFDVYPFRTSTAPYFTTGAQFAYVAHSGYDMATTQGHQPLDGNHVKQFGGDDRTVIVEYTLDDFKKKGKEDLDERLKEYAEFDEQNLYPDTIFEYEGAQWGMTIDLNTCIGCNACVTACQAENNIPVVGKTQVARHREMHWIRIDRYYSKSTEEFDPKNPQDPNPLVNWQPVMCVHCEKAPCEPVCPVAATVHSHEGLNQMVYNRCVGTRYCSNNCPYKVRRFNYLNFTDNQKQFDPKLDEKSRVPLLKMLNNPNVTVRGRGVMEKCTYCVQRINEVRIESKKQNRDIQDGEIVTACQQACPTKTIVFGNIADKGAEVTKLRNDPRAYLLLEELLTRPRTSHLAKLRNPNPAISRPQAAEAA